MGHSEAVLHVGNILALITGAGSTENVLIGDYRIIASGEKSVKMQVYTVLISSILRRYKHKLRKKAIEIYNCCHKQFFSIKVI